MSVRAEPVAPVGTPIKGPSALGGDFRRFLVLTWTLGVLEFKLKFFGSVLGYLWQLMKPLMLFGVLYVVFTEFVRIGGGVPFYPVVLLMGIVMFTFIAESTSAAVSSVVDRENLVRRIQFPRLAIPMAVVLTAFFNLSLNFLAVFVFMIGSGVELRLSWLELFPMVLFLCVFAAGLSTVLSAYFVRYRDVRPIWDVGIQVMFYATPILYPIESVADRYPQVAQAMMCNPLAVVIEQLRHAMIDPTAPSAAEAIGGGVRLLIPLAIVVGVWGFGLWAFNREAPRIAEDL